MMRRAGRRTTAVVTVVLVLAGCDQIGEQIGENATEAGQNAADQARRSAIDQLVEKADCRNLMARLADYEAGGHTEVVAYAREAADKLGCDE